MELPPPPRGLDLSQDRRVEIIVTSAITWALALVAIGLRMLCRRINRVELWFDDWFILASIIPSGAHVFGMAAYAVSRGLGQHIWVTPPDSLKAWAIGLFIAELSYFFTIVLVKWSILAFYWRSFNVRHSIRLPILAIATIVLLWGIAVITVTLLQCEPMHAFWSRFDPQNPTSPADYRCGIANIKFFYGNAIPTIVTDIMMLALPVPCIYSLKLPAGQKFALAGIFMVGIFVTMVSIIRLHYLVQGDLTDPDITWNFVDIGLWSVVEANIAMVCACLPFLRPIINRIAFGTFSMSSINSRTTQARVLLGGTNKNANSGRWDKIGGQARSSATVEAQCDIENDEKPLTMDLRSMSPSLAVCKSCEQALTGSRSGHLSNGSVGEGILVTKEVVMERVPFPRQATICQAT